MPGFFFGTSERPLFGFHHPAHGSSVGAVVLCPPGAEEYQFAHRSLYFLAKTLAGRGIDVLRFDPSGMGDSWGDTDVADLSGWVDEVGEAVAELQAISGQGSVDLVGLRLGAYVAMRAAGALDNVRRVVLWDPIVDGAAWVDHLGVIPTEDDGRVECGHAVVTPDFVEQLRSLTSEQYELPDVDGGRLLITQAGDWDEHPLRRGGRFEAEFLEQPASWVEDESIWTGQIPVEAVRRIADWLT